jgi:hypothetical protein
MVDLTPAFVAAGRGPGADAASLYLLGRFHLSDAGHRLAAEAIHRFLTEGEGRRLLARR